MGNREYRWAGGAHERGRDLYHAAAAFVVSRERSDSGRVYRSDFCTAGAEPLALLPHRGEWRPGFCRPSRCRPGWPVSGFGDSSRHAGSFRIRRTHRRGDVFSRSLVRLLLRLPAGTAQLNPKSDSASEQFPDNIPPQYQIGITPGFWGSDWESYLVGKPSTK